MEFKKFMVIASRAYEIDCNSMEEAEQILMEDVRKDFPTECVDLKVVPYNEYGLENGRTRDDRR